MGHREAATSRSRSREPAPAPWLYLARLCWPGHPGDGGERFSVTAIEEPAPSGAKPFFFSIWGGRSETWLRFGMVLLFVVLCYAFPWRVWRASVTAILIAVLQDHANSAISLTYDTFRYHGA